MVTITYDDKKTNPKKLAAVITGLKYGAEEVAVKRGALQVGFAPFPAPLPEKAPKSFADAFKAARAAHRPIVIDFWATWCGPCVKLKKKTLADPEVIKQLEGARVIYVNLDEHPELAKAYGVSSIPDVFFVNGQGLVVDRLRAFEESKPFLKRVQKMKEKAEKSAAPGIPTTAPPPSKSGGGGDRARQQGTITRRVYHKGRQESAMPPQAPAEWNMLASWTAHGRAIVEPGTIPASARSSASK